MDTINPLFAFLLLTSHVVLAQKLGRVESRLAQMHVNAENHMSILPRGNSKVRFDITENGSKLETFSQRSEERFAMDPADPRRSLLGESQKRYEYV